MGERKNITPPIYIDPGILNRIIELTPSSKWGHFWGQIGEEYGRRNQFYQVNNKRFPSVQGLAGDQEGVLTGLHPICSECMKDPGVRLLVKGATTVGATQ